MEIKDRTAAEYESALKKLLPQGSYWDDLLADTESDLVLVIKERAARLSEFRSRMNQLLREAFPASAEETIEDWERVTLGETYPSQTLTSRRAGLVNQLGFRSIYTIAESVGVKMSLEFPWTAGFFGHAKCGSTMCGTQAVFSALRVNVADGTGINTQDFEASITKLLLANHIPFFIYRPKESGYASIAELSEACALELKECFCPPASFGIAKAGQTRIASSASVDVRRISIPDTNANCRRFDIESLIASSMKIWQRAYFSYGKTQFLFIPEIDLSGCQSVQEVSEKTDVEITLAPKYQAGKMGLARCGWTRCASTALSDIIIVSVSKFNPAFRRNDFESAVRRNIGVWLKTYFKYGSVLFFVAPEINIDDCASIAEIEMRLGIEIAISYPYSMGKVGQAKCGQTACASPEKAQTIFADISKFNSELRLSCIESAVRRILGGLLHIYFRYGTEVFQ